MSSLINLAQSIQIDLNDLLIGDQLGKGFYRTVYSYRLDDSLVVKMETTDSRQFANVSEWTMWNELKSTKWAKWFAPCVAISSSGNVLIQKRCEPITGLPKSVPNVFADLKIENWGKINGQPVVFDYANNYVYDLAQKAIKMTKI